MINMEDKELKLIYVHKIGRTSDGYEMYEFIFKNDTSDLDVNDLGWEDSPAIDNAEPPQKWDRKISLKTKKFKLTCLHEAYDRPYIHGFYNIHALAYENVFDDDMSSDGHDSYDHIFDNSNDENDIVLVFHFDLSLQKIKELLYDKQIILNEKGDEFIESSSVEF